MEIDTIITLANNKKYLLLMEDSMLSDNYYLAVLLDQNEEPTNVYAALKEVEKGNEIYCEKVTDLLVLSKLLDDYKLQFQEEYEEEQK